MRACFAKSRSVVRNLLCTGRKSALFVHGRRSFFFAASTTCVATTTSLLCCAVVCDDTADSHVIDEGSTVRIHYTLRDASSSTEQVLDSSGGKEPLAFEVGAGHILAALDEAVRGMVQGEKRRITLENAYGEQRSDLIIEVPLEKLPAGTVVNAKLRLASGMVATVTGIRDDTVATLDGNHKLAGKAIHLDIEVVACAPPPRLIVELLSAGDGVTYPNMGDRCTMHYAGTLATTGAQFDSSRDRGQPFSFMLGVGQVIKGWDQGVARMSLGERAILRIPAALGYGSQGAGGVIPPNSDLVFDVELLAINEKNAQKGESVK